MERQVPMDYLVATSAPALAREECWILTAVWWLRTQSLFPTNPGTTVTRICPRVPRFLDYCTSIFPYHLGSFLLLLFFFFYSLRPKTRPKEALGVKNKKKRAKEIGASDGKIGIRLVRRKDERSATKLK